METSENNNMKHRFCDSHFAFSNHSVHESGPLAYEKAVRKLKNVTEGNKQSDINSDDESNFL